MAKPSNQLDVYRDGKAGVEIPLLLDKKRCDFYAIVFGKTLREKSMEQLRRVVRQAVLDATELAWQPIIIVKRYKPFAVETRDFVGFAVERCYIAKNARGCWVGLTWDEFHEEPEDKRLVYAREYFGPSFALYAAAEGWRDSDRDFHLEYTEAAWAAMQAILERIRLLRARLDELMQTREGVQQLELLGARGLFLGSGGAA